MTVRCCQSYEEIEEGDVGQVVRLDTEGLHELNVQVTWANHAGTYWVGAAHCGAPTFVSTVAFYGDFLLLDSDIWFAWFCLWERYIT